MSIPTRCLCFLKCWSLRINCFSNGQTRDDRRFTCDSPPPKRFFVNVLWFLCGYKCWNVVTQQHSLTLTLPSPPPPSFFFFLSLYCLLKVLFYWMLCKWNPGSTNIHLHILQMNKQTSKGWKMSAVKLKLSLVNWLNLNVKWSKGLGNIWTVHISMDIIHVELIADHLIAE